MLDRLEEEDFHVRYNAIEFLKVLLKNKKKQLQDCILTSPMGVSRLMDLLGDGHEAIRNGTFAIKNISLCSLCVLKGEIPVLTKHC